MRHTHIRIRIIIISLFIVCFMVSCKSDSQTTQKKIPATFMDKNDSQLFLSVDTLEKAGVEHFDPDFFIIIREFNILYILSGKDNLILRYDMAKGIFDKKFKTEIGKGPKEMEAPRSFFRRDPSTLAVHDFIKHRVFHFDNELNLLDEKVSDLISEKMFYDQDICYAMGEFQDNFLAILDDNYQIKETFKRIAEPKFQGISRFSLYMAYPLFNKQMAATTWSYFLGGEAQVEIVDVVTKETKLALKWEATYTHTQADRKKRQNFYSSKHVTRFRDLYLIQNTFTKNITTPPIIELLIFDLQGKFLGKSNVPYLIINTYDRKAEKQYYMDDDGNIYDWNLKVE